MAIYYWYLEILQLHIYCHNIYAFHKFPNLFQYCSFIIKACSILQSYFHYGIQNQWSNTYNESLIQTAVKFRLLPEGIINTSQLTIITPKFYIQYPMDREKLFDNKEVLLRECERHTASIAQPSWSWLGGRGDGEGSTPVLAGRRGYA